MWKYFKTLLSSQTSHDTSASLVGNFSMALFGTLFIVFVARSISLEEFGVFSSIVALYTLFSSLGDLGISGALINFIPKLNNPKKLISTAFWLQVAIAFMLVLAIRIKFIPQITHSQLVITEFIVGVFILENFLINLFRAQRKFVSASQLMVLDSSVKLILLTLLFFLKRIDSTFSI